MTVIRTARTIRRVRTTLLISTALSFAVGGQAFAQSVVDTTGTADITVNQPTASGAATAVYLKTNGGKIDATVGTVTSVATTTAGGAVISLETTGDKAINANFGSITTTGDGESTAVYAKTDAGNINIQTGAIDSTGPFNIGVNAVSNSGNVALTGDTLVLRGTTFDVNGNTGDGFLASSTSGTASITLNRGEIASPIGSIAAAITGTSASLTGGNATVVVGSGKATGDRGTTVFSLVNGAGTASTTTLGTVEATGSSVGGVVSARSTGGAAVINAATTIASGGKFAQTGTYSFNSYAILGQSLTGTTINAGTTSATGFGIRGIATAGDVTITTTGNTSSQLDSAVAINTNNNTVSAVNGTINLGAGTTTSTAATANYAAVYINNVTNNATVNSAGTVTGAGNTAVVVYAPNIATVNSNVVTNSNGGGIYASGTKGTVINAGTTTASAGGIGIMGVASQGDVTISTTGDTYSPNAAAVGIFTNNANTAAVNGTINLAAGTTTASNSTNWQTVYINNVTNNATVNSLGTVNAAGSAAIAVYAPNVATVNSNVVTNTNGFGIIASGAKGAVINAGTTTTAGTTYGIQGNSTQGDVTITTTGNTSAGTNSAIAIKSDTTGAASAVNATINLGANTTTTKTGGTNAAVWIDNASASATVNSLGTIETNGGFAIAATSQGLTTVTSNIINNASGGGISATGATGVSVTAGKTTTTTAGVTASSTTGNVTIATTGDVLAGGGVALQGTTPPTAGLAGGNVSISTAAGTLTRNTSPSAITVLGQARGDVTLNLLGTVQGAQTPVANSSAAPYTVVASAGSANGTGKANVNIFEVRNIANGTAVAISGAGGATLTGGTVFANNATPNAGVYNGSTYVGGTNGSAVQIGSANGNITVDLDAITGKAEHYMLGVSSGSTTSAVNITVDNVVNGNNTVPNSLTSTTGTVLASGGIGALSNGTISITAGNVEANGTAIGAGTVDGAITVTSGTALSRHESAIAIDVGSTSGNVTINAGTTSGGGRAIDASTDTGDITISTTGNTTSRNDGPAIGADGKNVTITLAAGTVTDGFEGGIEAEARGNMTINALGTIKGHDDDAIGIYAEIVGNGTANIKSNAIEITGTGEDPGVTAGYRQGQGGIVVEAEGGAVNVESNTMTVAGDNRYGIYVLGTGAIDVKSTNLTYAAQDSAGIMIIGGAGNVSVNSGTLNSTGASGAGIVANTTSGNITIVADQTHATNTGLAGNFTADMVVAQSQTGNVNITSNSASTAGLYGTAVAGVGANVTINSTTAAASGNQGSIVYGSALNGDATITSGTVTSTGQGTGAIIGAATGKVNITSGTITSTAVNATGIRGTGQTGTTIAAGTTTTDSVAIWGRAPNGDVTITTTGDTKSKVSNAVWVGTTNNTVAAQNATVNLGAGTVTSSDATANISTVFLNNVANDATLNAAGTITGAANNAAAVAIYAGNKAVANTNIVTSTGNNALFASGVNGSTINAGTTTGTFTGIWGVSSLGDVAITTTGNTTGGAGNAILGQATNATPPAGNTGGKVSITTAAGTTTTTTGTAATVLAQGRNDVTLNLNGVTTGAQTAAAVVNASTTAGNLSLTANEVRNTGTGSAINATGSGTTANVGVTATTVQTGTNSNAGIVANNQSGNASVTVGSLTGAANFRMIDATSGTATGTVAVNVANLKNDSTVANSVGVNAVARGGVTIVAGNVEAQSWAIRAATNLNSQNGALLGDGNVSITTTGDVTSRGNNAISVSGLAKSFDITLAAGHTVTGYGSSVVAGGTRTGDGGNATVTNNGTIAARGNAEGGIGITAFGNATVVSNVITVEGNGAVTSGFVAGGIGAASSGGGNVSVTSNSVTVAGANRHGISAQTSGAGIVTVNSTTISSAATDAAAIRAISDTGNITVTSGTITATGAGSRGIEVNAEGTGNVSITSGTIASVGRGIDAESDQGDVTINVTGNTTSTGDDRAAITASAGHNLTINLAAGTETSGLNGGIEAEAGNAVVVNALGTIRGSSGKANGIYAETEAAGTVTIKSNVIELTGTGDDPGLDGDFRAGQGGIVAQAESGAVSIDSGTMTVAGDNRYGIYVQGGGAIDVKSTNLTYAAQDSAGIMILGGAGAVTVNSGTLTATGTSGSGIAARTTSGDITITADQTHSTGTGIVGSYSGDAVVGLSDSGAVRITSNNASSDSKYGSAVAGVGGSVVINSTTAAASGQDGAIVFGQALAGDATITSGTINSTGLSTDALVGRATGKVTITSGTISSTGNAGTGILAQGTGGNTVTTGSINTGDYAVRAVSGSGDTAVTVNGTVASRDAYGVYVQGTNSTVTVEAGKSVTGKTEGVTGTGRTLTTVTNAGTISGGVGVSLGGNATIANTGTIIGTTGAAIVSTGATNLTNSGTLTGTGGFAAILSGSADTVTLKTGSAVTGQLDGGAGSDTLILNGTGAASAASQTLAGAVNFEHLDVAAGYWTTGANAAEFEDTLIRQGATLQVNFVNGVTPITGGLITNNGTIAVNATGTNATLAEVRIGGTGGLNFIGSGTTVITSPNLTYTGVTNVNAGTVQLASGNLAGDVVIASGATFRLGNGGTTGTLGGKLTANGTFIFDRSDSYTIAGDFSGSGQLTKNGTGILTFGGNYAFTGTTTVNGGSVKFTGQLAPTTEIALNQGTLDLSGVQGGQQTIGELAGSSAGTVALGGSDLTVNQSTSTTFAGTITGTGGLEKSGTGTLNLTGTSTYSGNTEVTGGTLKVNGAIPNSTVVTTPGGTLGGNGTVGGIQAQGGTIAPGNSIGRITVNGNVTLTAATVYAVEVNNLGQADRVDATGTATLGNATLQVLAEAGRYAGRTSYTILTAAGGVSGKFGTLTSNFAFLTPSVNYGANTVTLILTRNDAAFASFAGNVNQVGVANTLQALGGGNALFEEALVLQDAKVAPAFASLTGEVHGAVSTGQIENTQALRRSLLDRAAPEGAGFYGWANALGNWGSYAKSTRSGQVETDLEGAIGGVGYAANGFDASIGVAATRSNFSGQGHADGKSRLVTGTIGYTGDYVWAKAGGSYSWDEFDTRRNSSLGTIAQTLTDSYDGHSSQLFGELGYAMPIGDAQVGPFVGIAHVNTHVDAIAEAGGSTGLNVAANDREVTFATMGFKVRSVPVADAMGMVISPNASVAYRHAWGDRSDPLAAGFVGTTPVFGILGPRVDREAAEVGLGISATSGRFRLNAGYTGLYSKGGSNHSAQISIGIAF